MSKQIEVAVSPDLSTTEKGKLLEGLVHDLLELMQYTAAPPTRMTALEIDVPAENRVSGQSIIVECKAYRDRVSADVLKKLLGNVHFLGVSQGWLVITSPLRACLRSLG